MDRYEIRCTEEQVFKALKLGAPLEKDVAFAGDYDFDSANKVHISKHLAKTAAYQEYATIPTAEQMLGWLEEQGILIDIDTEWNKSVLVYVWDCENKSLINNVFHGSRKEATLAAIDAALEYLMNNRGE